MLFVVNSCKRQFLSFLIFFFLTKPQKPQIFNTSADVSGLEGSSFTKMRLLVSRRTTGEERRRAEARGRERRLLSLCTDSSFGGRSLGAPGAAECSQSAHGAAARSGSAQTHRCGNRGTFARPDPTRPDLPGPAERSAGSPAFVRGSSRSLPMSPTRCPSLHLQLQP